MDGVEGGRETRVSASRRKLQPKPDYSWVFLFWGKRVVYKTIDRYIKINLGKKMSDVNKRNNL